MNIFANLTVYAGKWSVKSERAFDAEEIGLISSAVVVPSEYGNSVMFTMIAGGQTYIPLDNSSELGVGEFVDMTKAKLITLEKQGESDIIRVKA